MNFANVKGIVAKVLAVGVLAGAVVMAAPTKAQAQEVIIAGPGPYARPYARHDFYARDRFEAFRRHEAFVREREFRAREYRHFERGRFDRGYR